MSVLAPELERVRDWTAARIVGRVSALRGLTVLVDSLPLPVGAVVTVRAPGVPLGSAGRARGMPGEVVGFSREQSVVMLLGGASGIRPGDAVVGEETHPLALVGSRLLGRCIDGLGRPIDGGGDITELVGRPLTPAPISPLRRRRVDRMLETGVRAIDLMTTLGRGQRLGIFAGPGVGKSTLLGLIARRTAADVCVIGLIGERGREVRDFLEETLGPAGRARSVVVTATGDESPVMRLRAAKLACTVAEFFRDEGRDVLLMMDSITRFAHAQRQVGLAVGEPPATRGYTPSVFAQLAALLERAGALEAPVERRSAAADAPAANPVAPASRAGSITGLYTILVEGDDMTEPVADAARGILDGHVVLSRKLAQRAHFPAIDVLDSVSRTADQVIDAPHGAARRAVARLMALYRDVEELVQVGAYARGASAETDLAIELQPAINELLRQGGSDTMNFVKAREALLKLGAQASDAGAPRRGARGTSGSGS